MFYNFTIFEFHNLEKIDKIFPSILFASLYFFFFNMTRRVIVISSVWPKFLWSIPSFLSFLLSLVIWFGRSYCGFSLMFYDFRNIVWSERMAIFGYFLFFSHLFGLMKLLFLIFLFISFGQRFECINLPKFTNFLILIPKISSQMNFFTKISLIVKNFLFI